MAASVAADHGHHEGHVTNTGLSNEKLAMWTFLGSECLLFGALISTYLLYKGRSVDGPEPAEMFDIPFTSASSFMLLMSSLTMVLALSAIQRGDGRRLRLWLLATAALGSLFITGQVYEFTSFYREGLSLSTNLFGSTFYVLTGFHGVHVTLGILFLLSLFSLSARGKLGPEKTEVVELTGLYWHFVDVVWIVIFTVIYLIPLRGAMATETETDTEAETGAEIGEDHALPGTGPTHGEHPTEGKYWKIFFILFAITAVEVLLYYKSFPGVHLNNFVLLALAGAKFIIVAGYFMHLKFDSRILRRLFVSGFVLAVSVYVAYLLTMGVFIDKPNARH